MMKLKVFLSTACLWLFQAAAIASPINLQLTFTVAQIDRFGLPATDFSAPPTIGSTYFAYLMIDDAILANDGVNKAGKVLGFSGQVGDSVWNPLLPSSRLTDFAGFRGPCYGPMACTPAEWGIWGLDSEFLGFDVTGGHITGVYGGVYGLQDAPFIDFHPGGTFGSLSWFRLQPPTVPDPDYGWIALNGGITVTQLSEPAMPLLLGIGVVMLLAATRR